MCWTAFRSLRYLAPLLVLLLRAGVSSAQQPVPAPRDTAAADSAAADTAGARPRVPDVVADSIIGELMELDGYIATEYVADTAVYVASEGVLRMRGAAQVQREGDRLNADTIVYWERDQLVRASGSPSVTGQQTQELTGKVLYYDLAAKRASVEDARTTITQQASWFVRGALVSAVGNDRIYASHARFTTCDLEIPHYHFESDRIKIIRDKLLVAVPARLYFGNVPVMVLPFVVQNLEEGRRSGLLVPRFTVTDIVRNNSGYTREISDLGWYWAINDYLGGQVAGTWRSGAYVSLVGNVQFNWRRQFLQGNAGFTRYWQSDGGRNFGVNSQASWRPDERTNLGLSANFVSDERFIRRTTIDPREATQDMTSTINIGRRFDWGTLQLGSDLRKSISDGGIAATLPSFSVSPNTITLFPNTNLETARWYNNASVAWNLSGRRSLTRDRLNGNNPLQDETRTELQGGITQFSFGNLSLSATGDLNQQQLDELISANPTTGAQTTLPAASIDKARWQANAAYQIRLIGQTSISPSVSLSQEIQRDSLTGGSYLAGPRRMAMGAGTSFALFGLFGGIGPYSAIRHRISPTVGYSYAPEVSLTDAQRKVFGASGGYAQNRVTLGINQTFEGKLRAPRAQPDPPHDTSVTATDSSAIRQPSEPLEPQKVTLLSINTSSVEYDFVRAAREGSGFVTTHLSNSITSDYLRGLTIQMSHELFDRRSINPNDPGQRGQLGTFAPRLESLSTGFDLGPNSAIFRWIGLGNEQNEVTQGQIQGRPPTDAPTVPGSQTATNNPRGGIGGGGDWRMSLSYAFSRPQRTYLPDNGLEFDDRAVQTVDGNLAFPLTPGWAMTWNTSYSITDREFGSHRLNFRRDLHRWEANFSFYQTPTGNTAFEFFVNLIDNPDIKFDHRETNLGIDR